MKIIMMVLGSAIGLILIAGLVICEVSICKKHPKKKYILPVMCLILAVLSVFGVVFFAVVAYRDEPEVSPTVVEFDRTSDDFLENVEHYMDEVDAHVENKDLYESYNSVTVYLDEHENAESMFIYDKNGNEVFTVLTEKEDVSSEKGIPVSLILGLGLVLFLTFVITLILALTSTSRKVSESEEIDILNL